MLFQRKWNTEVIVIIDADVYKTPNAYQEIGGFLLVVWKIFLPNIK